MNLILNMMLGMYIICRNLPTPTSHAKLHAISLSLKSPNIPNQSRKKYHRKETFLKLAVNRPNSQTSFNSTAVDNRQGTAASSFREEEYYEPQTDHPPTDHSS